MAQDQTLIEIRQSLIDLFTESELKSLCFELSIDYEELPGNQKNDKARELVLYCKRHALVSPLIRVILRLRPNVTWSLNLLEIPTLIIDVLSELYPTEKEIRLFLVNLQKSKKFNLEPFQIEQFQWQQPVTDVWRSIFEFSASKGKGMVKYIISEAYRTHTYDEDLRRIWLNTFRDEHRLLSEKIDFPPINLPENPYRLLESFTQDQNAVFFGREDDLYRFLIEFESAAFEYKPFFLIHAASGTGKSSFVKAGLIPAFVNQKTQFGWNPLYSTIKGNALKTIGIMIAKELLKLGFLDNKDMSNYEGSGWKDPVLVSALFTQLVLLTETTPVLILDQFEEVFTQSSDEERSILQIFLKKVARQVWPKDFRPPKIMLVYRSDFHGDIEGKLLREMLVDGAFFTYHLPELSKKGVLDALRGASMKFPDFYRFSFESGVAEEIADRLWADHSGPVAPRIQIAGTALLKTAGWKSGGKENLKIDFNILQSAGNIEGILSNFVNDQIKLLASRGSDEIAIEILRAMTVIVDGRLAQHPRTLDDLFRETRLSIDDLIDVTKYLQDEARIIIKDRSDGPWRLAEESILSVISEWGPGNVQLREVRKLLGERNEQWNTHNNDSQFLLGKEDLKRVENCFGDLDISKYEIFIHASRDRIQALDYEDAKTRADKAVNAARELLTEYENSKLEIVKLEEESLVISKQVSSWSGLLSRQSLIKKRRSIYQKQLETRVFLAQAESRLWTALQHFPDHKEAKELLSNLAKLRLYTAESSGQREQLPELEEIAKRSFVIIKEYGYLSLITEPVTTTVSAFHMTENEMGLIVKGECINLGEAPILNKKLQRGSWLFVLSSPGYQNIRYPVFIGRETKQKSKIKLYPESDFDLDYALISAGPFISGGDPESINNDEAWHEERLDDYFIQKYPVTVSQYAKFLNDLIKTDRDQAFLRLPRLMEGDPYRQETDDQTWAIINEQVVIPESWGKEYPIVGVDYTDAEAYCTWLSVLLNAHIRLPTAQEFEKAARGADGRYFPWGNDVDPSFCNMQESFETPHLTPIGYFETDCSIYGVHDLAGGVNQWLSNWFKDPIWKEARCGSYTSTSGWSRSCSRYGALPTYVRGRLGFRTLKLPKNKIEEIEK